MDLGGRVKASNGRRPSADRWHAWWIRQFIERGPKACSKPRQVPASNGYELTQMALTILKGIQSIANNFTSSDYSDNSGLSPLWYATLRIVIYLTRQLTWWIKPGAIAEIVTTRNWVGARRNRASGVPSECPGSCSRTVPRECCALISKIGPWSNWSDYSITWPRLVYNTWLSLVFNFLDTSGPEGNAQALYEYSIRRYDSTWISSFWTDSLNTSDPCHALRQQRPYCICCWRWKLKRPFTTASGPRQGNYGISGAINRLSEHNHHCDDQLKVELISDKQVYQENLRTVVDDKDSAQLASAKQPSARGQMELTNVFGRNSLTGLNTKLCLCWPYNIIHGKLRLSNLNTLMSVWRTTASLITGTSWWTSCWMWDGHVWGTTASTLYWKCSAIMLAILRL